MSVRFVPPWDVAREWDALAPLLALPLKRQSALDLEALKGALIAGRMHAWLGDEIALVTEIQAFARERVCVIVLAGGANFVTRQASGLREQTLATIERYARSHGCGALQIVGRPGWARFGFEATGEVVLRRGI